MRLPCYWKTPGISNIWLQQLKDKHISSKISCNIQCPDLLADNVIVSEGKWTAVLGRAREILTDIWRFFKYTGAMELSFPASMHTGGIGELMQPAGKAPICILCVCTHVHVSLCLHVTEHTVTVCSECMKLQEWPVTWTYLSLLLSLRLPRLFQHLDNTFLFASRCNSGGKSIFLSS